MTSITESLWAVLLRTVAISRIIRVSGHRREAETNSPRCKAACFRFRLTDGQPSGRVRLQDETGVSAIAPDDRMFGIPAAPSKRGLACSLRAIRSHRPTGPDSLSGTFLPALATRIGRLPPLPADARRAKRVYPVKQATTPRQRLHQQRHFSIRRNFAPEFPPFRERQGSGQTVRPVAILNPIYEEATHDTDR